MGRSQDPIELNREFVPVARARETPDRRSRFRLSSLFERRLAWEQLLSYRRVVVLGGARAGKTSEFKLRAECLRRDGYQAVYCRIDQLANRDIERVLSPCEVDGLDAWKIGSTDGYVFLDALDEARADGGLIRPALLNLRHRVGPAFHRLHLFIACRSSDWRSSADLAMLDEILRDVGPAPAASDESESHRAVEIVRLDALNLQRVETLARGIGAGDVDGLMKALREAGADPLVALPGDVVMLVDLWERHRRLGSWTELIESTLRERMTETRDTNSYLPAEEARNGARRLAAAAVLQGTSYYSTSVDPDRTEAGESVVRPRQVLSDWSDEQVADLLNRPLFEAAAVDRVRIQHRALEEFLSAECFLSLVNRGLPRRKLFKLLFPDVDGSQTVPSNLGPVVAWLCLHDGAILQRTITIAPEVLVSEGDPSALELGDREAVLRSFVRKFADGSRLREYPDQASLRRFGRGELAGMINQLLEAGSDQTRIVLLQIVAEAALEDCADAAVCAALDAGGHLPVRCAAVRAVGAAGRDAHRRRLLPLLDRVAELDPELTAGLLAVLIPDVLTVERLVGVLVAAPSPTDHSLTSLDWLLRNELPRRLAAVASNDLIRLLNMPLPHPDDQSSAEYVPPGAPRIYQAAGGVLAVALDGRRSGCQYPEVVWQLLFAVSGLADRDDEAKESLRQAKDALAGNANARQQLLWWSVAEMRRAHATSTRSHRIPALRGVLDLRSRDLEWLAQDVRCRSDQLDRLVALDVLMTMPVTEEVRQSRDEILDELVKDDEILVKRLSRYRAKSRPRDAWQIRDARREVVRRGRDERDRAAARNALEGRIPEIRLGTDKAALAHLWEIGSRNLSALRECSTDAISNKYGEEVAAAAREGMKNFWWHHDPGLPNPRPRNGTFPVLNGVALAGLGFSVADRMDIAAEPAETLARAARFAAWELNGFPDWLDQIALARPDLLADTFRDGVRGELASAEEPSDRGPLLGKLSGASQPVLKACASMVLSVLREVDARQAERLQAAVEATVQAEGIDLAAFDDLAGTRCRGHVREPELFAIWWCAWAQHERSHSLDLLEETASAQAADAADRLVEACCHRLWQWTERFHVATLQVLEDARALGRLLPLAFSHVRPAADLVHRRTYSPCPRDDAQMMRNRLLDRLARMPTPAARSELRRLASDERMVDYRSVLLHLAANHAADFAAGGSEGATEVLARLTKTDWSPESPDALYRTVLDRLDDIRLFIEQGDHSYRGLLSAPSVKESDVQRWLAAELELRSRHQYRVVREEEVDQEKLPDIRVHSARFSGPISIEVKIADHCTFAKLEHGLRTQLVGHYLSPAGSRHGILLLCALGRQQRWEKPGEGLVDFRTVERTLREIAEELRVSSPFIEQLSVEVIEFFLPS